MGADVGAAESVCGGGGAVVGEAIGAGGGGVAAGDSGVGAAGSTVGRGGSMVGGGVCADVGAAERRQTMTPIGSSEKAGATSDMRYRGDSS